MKTSLLPRTIQFVSFIKNILGIVTIMLLSLIWSSADVTNTSEPVDLHNAPISIEGAPIMIALSSTIAGQCPTPPANPTYTEATFNGNLNSGETVVFSSGTYSGNLNSFSSGSEIYVLDGATFSPGNINNPAGKIINCGTSNFGSLTLGTGVEFENYGEMNFSSNPNMNGSVTFLNAEGAIINFNGNFVLANGSSLTNNGTVNAYADLNTNQGTTLTNNYLLETTGGNFNPGGTVDNYGGIYSREFININSNSSVTNYCMLSADKGFNNNSGNTVNNGYIVVTGINGNPDDLIQNNAAFHQGPDGIVSGVRFMNNSTVTGSGDYYFSDDTRNQGTFGADVLGINFFDASNSNTSAFDVGTGDASVTSNSISSVDRTDYSAPTCGALVGNTNSADTDGDGIPDSLEGTGDRDGDGIPDYEDADPQGYFFNEATGEIIPGGLITISGPSTANIILDGSSGKYQWTVSTDGIYTMTIDVPTDYTLSTTCLDQSPPAFDPTGLADPLSLGHSENGSTGLMTNTDCTTFYTVFDLAVGDPFIINNNIPLTYSACAAGNTAPPLNGN